MATSFEYIYKYIIIGDSGVGKSCILLQFEKNTFDQNKENTVGVEFGNKIIEVDGRKTKLQIWDTAGQEQFKSITRSYYRAVAGALLVFDVTNERSFENVKNWLEEARANGNPELVILLVGNKVDMTEKRRISREVAEKLANDNGIKYMEASAKERINIDPLFLTVAQDIKAKVEAGRIDVECEDFGVRRSSQQPKAVKNRHNLHANVTKEKKGTGGSGCC